MLNREKEIIEILSSQRVNMSKIVGKINKKGLSTSSLYNKANPNHRHSFKQDELDDIGSELKDLANYILKKLG